MLLNIIIFVNMLIILYSAALTVANPNQKFTFLILEDTMNRDVFSVAVIFFSIVVLPVTIKEYGWENLFEDDFKKEERRRENEEQEMTCPRCGKEMTYFDKNEHLGEHWTCFHCASENDQTVMIFPKNLEPTP